MGTDLTLTNNKPAGLSRRYSRGSMTTLTSKKRLTVKDIYGTPKKLGDDSDVLEIVRITGIVSSIRETEDKYSPGHIRLALVGEFEAVNVSSGDIFYGPKAFLPYQAQTEIQRVFRESNSKKVHFAYSISYKNSATRTGYEYVCRALIKTAYYDSLVNLRPNLKAKTKKAT